MCKQSSTQEAQGEETLTHAQSCSVTQGTDKLHLPALPVDATEQVVAFNPGNSQVKSIGSCPGLLPEGDMDRMLQKCLHGA